MGARLTLIAAAAFAGALAAGGAARAPDASQEQRMVAPGKLRVAGRWMRCGATPTLISHSFWDYGGATKGVIILNPTKLEALPDAVRLYVYAHECGHQIYGPRETRADCYAIKRGVREGWLDHAGMDQVCHFLKNHPGDYVHPPGPARCEQMRQCFKDAKPHRASR